MLVRDVAVGVRPAGRAGQLRGVLAAAMFLMVSLAVPGAATGAETVGDADDGRATFTTNCARCHGPAGGGTRAAPDLGGVLERLTLDEVRQTITGGRGGMPAFGDELTEAEIDDVIVHLGQLDGAASTTPGRGPGMRPWWDDMMRDGAPGTTTLMWVLAGVLLPLLVVAGVVWLVRTRGSDAERSRPPSSGPTSTGAGSAREELDRRYARGEVDREEYRRIRDEIDGPAR